ncbi:MAG TPA: DUF3168 domain-containing protein [Rhabdaerophilum sp.]|nr:DUF3168 domain-containing protein [Rhabdaerophilum sp.]
MSGTAHPVRALQEVLRNHLLAQPAIAAILGQAIYENPPRGAKPPFIAFGDATVRDAGSTESEAAVIEFDLLAHAAERRMHSALDMAVEVAAALQLPMAPPVGYHLVSIEIRQGVVRHDPARNLTRASLRLRAFLEPL